MALSLNQVDNNRKKKAQESINMKDKPSRPWEAASSASASFTGNQAVKRAEQIVEKNNVMVEELRSLGAEKEQVEEIEEMISKREEIFSDFETQNFEVKKIAGKRGILNRVKSLFMQ